MIPDFGPAARMAWLQFWQVAVVAGVAGVVAWAACRRRPRLAYSLWLLVLIKALVPPLWASPLGVFSQALSETPASSPVRGDPPDRRADDPATAPLPAAGPIASRTDDSAALGEGRRSIGDRLLVVAAGIWLAGSVVGCAAALAKLRGWRRLLDRSARPAGGELASTIVELARTLHMRRGFKVFTSREFVGPLVCGVLRPRSSTIRTSLICRRGRRSRPAS